jgi:mannose-6-phosphate isomerase-like protein (cupin superfamily)
MLLLAKHRRAYSALVSDAILIPSGGGEIVGDSADRRVEILSDHDTLHSTWSRFGPHREGADLHVHRHHTDMFFVLEGELTVMLGTDGETAVVPAGTLARVPPLVVHGFRNGSDAEVRYLNFHAPGKRFADFLRALRDGQTFTYDQHPPPADGGRPITEAVIGGGEVVAEGVTLVADIDAIGIAETRSEAGEASPPAHVHRRHVESFYVLEGELALTAGDREVSAEPGTWLQVPAGTPHTFAITGGGPARFLNLHTPSCGFGAFLRGLHQARTADELSAVRAAFDQEPA